MTQAEIRALLKRCDARQLREESGISAYTVQRALGISRFDLARWETGKAIPWDPRGIRWARLIAVLERHALVTAEMAATEDGSSGATGEAAAA